MEIKKIHNVEIYINDNRADIFSQDDLNLRFNNTFADPSKISTIQTEYSFSFTLPVTPQNQKIFDFAEIPSKRHKFNKYFKTTISADGMLVFDGDLILQSISKEGYKCNLYVNKLNTVDKIFGETTLNEISGWEVDYDQHLTINEYNSGEINYDTRDIFFPLVSYGLFQKMPGFGDNYSSKFWVDDTSRIYNENFYPSFNLLKLVEKCFETKGYTVDGDIFDDKVLRKIYTSTPLASEQDPIYNYGKGSMGKFDMDFTFTNYKESGMTINGVTLKADQFATAVPVALDVPRYSTSRNTEDIVYHNWEYNNVYDVWSTGDNFLTKEFNQKNNILWRENRLVAPVDGWYKISLDLKYQIDQTKKFKRLWYDGGKERTIGTDGTWTFDQFATEFQLLKNDAEGTSAKMIVPDSITAMTFLDYDDGNLTTEYSTLFDYRTLTSFPQEPTWVDLIGNFDINNPTMYLGGYTAPNNGVLNYDPHLNPDFIMGCTTSGYFNYASYLKNGKSWKKDCDDIGQIRYKGNTYYGSMFTTSGINQTEIAKDGYGNSTLPNATSTISRNSAGTSASTHLECIVFLKKNDYLQLKMLERQWENKDDVSDWNYGNKSQDDAIIKVDGNIKFECFAPSDKITVDSPYMDWNNPTLFPELLNIGQFLPNDEKMSDFVNNFIKEFNLSYQQNGKNITLNKQFIDFKTKNAVDLSDRVSRDEIEMEMIEFPSKMSVQYTINDEERGFYISAERNATDEQIQSNDWKEFADRGYDVIDVMPDEWANESKVTTKTSYNWFERFTFFYYEPTQKTRAVVMNPDNRPVRPEVPDDREDEFVEGGGGGGGSSSSSSKCMTINYTVRNGGSGTITFKDLFGNILTSQYISSSTTKKLCGITDYTSVWVYFSGDGVISGSGYPSFTFRSGTTASLTITGYDTSSGGGDSGGDSGGGGGSSTGTTGDTGGGDVLPNKISKVVKLPVIGKDEWYIEGYKYAEMMKYDGHNMKRRYWFPSDTDSGVYVYLNNDLEKPVQVKLVADTYDNVNLSYKMSNGDIETLLTRYFNIFYDADTNYIKFECYLTTEEYLAIKNGSNIIVDNDIYIPIELKGYDVSGGNTTEIIAIKK